LTITNIKQFIHYNVGYCSDGQPMPYEFLVISNTTQFRRKLIGHVCYCNSPIHHILNNACMYKTSLTPGHNS